MKVEGQIQGCFNFVKLMFKWMIKISKSHLKLLINCWKFVIVFILIEKVDLRSLLQATCLLMWIFVCSSYKHCWQKIEERLSSYQSQWCGRLLGWSWSFILGSSWATASLRLLSCLCTDGLQHSTTHSSSVMLYGWVGVFIVLL